MLATERVRLTDWHRRFREIMKQLDQTNIKIISTMWKYGPRNLLEVSRRTEIPFTSVYHRVAKLENNSKFGFVALVPKLSKLGMTRVVVLVTAAPGLEDMVTETLKIPDWWRSVQRSEGNFTHVSTNSVPAKFLGEFKTYLRRLSDLNLVTQLKIIQTGEYIPNFPSFNHYDPRLNQWTFNWKIWLSKLAKKPSRTIEDPQSYATVVDKNDLLIVKELEKNGRRSFADLAPILKMTLQGVKYHYDRKLVSNGIVDHFCYDVLPFPIEVSAYHEIQLNFTSNRAMNSFYSLIPDLFFILGVSKVLRKEALMVRSYILQNQTASMFSFLSAMARSGILETYSSVRLDLAHRETQTISNELFDTEKGWTFDLKKSLSELSKLARAETVRQRA